MTENRRLALVAALMLLLAIVFRVSANAEEASNNNFEVWYVNANSGLNCRRTPEVATDNIAKTYARGTELYIIGVDETGQWWETWDGEMQGWCHSSYLVATKEDLDKNSIGVGRYIGNFRITGYTPSPSENGGYSVTALGDNLWNSVGWAIAADPRVIPLGTKVYIKGIGYREVRDTGGAIKGNRIDVLTSSNRESYSITGNYDVYLAY